MFLLRRDRAEQDPPSQQPLPTAARNPAEERTEQESEVLKDHVETEWSYFFTCKWQQKIFKYLELHKPHQAGILSHQYYPVYNVRDFV